MALPDIPPADRQAAFAGAQMYLLRVILSKMAEDGRIDRAFLDAVVATAPTDAHVREATRFIVEPIYEGWEVSRKPH